MKLTPVDEKELKSKYRNTKVYSVLLEFSNSEHTAVRLDDHAYKTPNSGAMTFNKAAKHFNMPHIRATTRNGNIYLIKEL